MTRVEALAAKINQLLSEYRPGAAVEIGRLICADLMIRHGVRVRGKSEDDADFVRWCENESRHFGVVALLNGKFWRGSVTWADRVDFMAGIELTSEAEYRLIEIVDGVSNDDPYDRGCLLLLMSGLIYFHDEPPFWRPYMSGTILAGYIQRLRAAKQNNETPEAEARG